MLKASAENVLKLSEENLQGSVRKSWSGKEQDRPFRICSWVKEDLAQRCAAVARRARPRRFAPQGRADLRAAQHSGGRPSRRLAGRGPQNSYKLLIIYP